MPSLRTALPEDAASFQACFDAVARERRWLARVEGPPVEQVRGWIASAIEAGLPHWVAVDAERVVGWCGLPLNAMEGFRHSAELGMGVLDGYRERGLGAQLLERALGAGRAFGIARVSLEVFASNPRAIALYQRFGFAPEGVKRGARILDGRSDDIVCMVLWLREPATLGARPVS